MDDTERDAIASICLLAAFADGGKSEQERTQIKSILEGLGATALPALYQRVLLKQTSVAAETAKVTSAESRSLAYEMAVCVCDADGAANAAETAFLEELRQALGLADGAAQDVRTQADALATAAVEPSAAAASPAAADDLDQTILQQAILTAGLELLPQSLASLAIIPLQMRLVYRVGQQHGARLDAGQVKELLATVGVGLTGQVVETFARKLLGGFARMAGGKVLGGMTGAATGAALTFATTFALGQVARSYYAGGRRIDPQELRRLFRVKVEEAKALYARYQPDVEVRAQSLDVRALLPLVRGQ